VAVAFHVDLGQYIVMIDLKLETPVVEEAQVDAGTLAGIDRGLEDANAGRTVPIDEFRNMIAQWISRFESQRPR
jgi:predicted transcriptional regulator